TQARIDSGRQTVVGLNKYLPAPSPQPLSPTVGERGWGEGAEAIDVLKVDTTAVREAQIASLKKLRAERDPAQVEATLTAWTEAAGAGIGNLLELAIDAARAMATVGEISAALERVYGRYQAPVRAVRGVYAAEVGRGQAKTAEVRCLMEQFEMAEGRR